MDREITFGQIVKERRDLLGLTQAELGRRVGCAAITVRKIEADALRPSVQIAEHLAAALGIPEAEYLAFVRLARASHEPSPLPTPPPIPEEIGLEDLSGRAIRGYQLGERVGSGGYGVVYRAIQATVNRDVAVKIILPKFADRPEFIRRFEAEAQLVARLEHPHIVPLYDYWREPGVAYLVMRLLRGGSLAELLKNGPFTLDFVRPLMEQICAGLHAAHQAGVVHRDIKPANILLDGAGNAYLADFGIAKITTSENGGETLEGMVLGSPAYISPEQILVEPVKPQSDIYSLGVMLYELLTGHKPFKGTTPFALVQKHLNEPFPSLAAHRLGPDLVTRFDPIIQRATAKDQTQRYPDVPSLLADFRGRGWKTAKLEDKGETSFTLPSHPPTSLLELTNPYKGLRAFGEADAVDFFGRETLVQELLARLAESSDLARFLAVIGPSGSGKSSVVRAGLIPALRQGGLPGSEQWFFVEMLPGKLPWEELEAALLRIAVNPPASLLSQLQEDERGLLRAVRRVLPQDEAVELVLIIDQFEELFTLTGDEAVRSQFLNSLVAAVLDPRSRLRLVVTLRADFTDRPLQYVDFGELLRQRAEFVLPFTSDELEQAITSPAHRVGLSLEPGLVADMSRDIGQEPGALPLLQYALTELFERREDNTLTRVAYQASGGVLGALTRRADELYHNLEPAGQETAHQLFLRLVTLGEGAEDTRRRVLRAEVEALTGKTTGMDGEAIGEVIDAFGRYRLLSFDRDPITRGPTVEVAHEALLREWGQLREWLDAGRNDIRLQRLVATAAAEWRAANQDASFLLRGARLDQLASWTEITSLAQTPEERTFLEASLAGRKARRMEEEVRQQRELETVRKLAETEAWSARRLRWLAVGLIILLITASGAAWVAFNSRTEALVQRQIADDNAAQARANFTRSEAQRLAAEANALVLAGDNAEVIGLLAAESLGVQYSPQGDAALQAAAGLDYPLRILAGHEAELWAVTFAPDGQTVLSASVDGTARLWDVASGELVQEFAGHKDEVNSVAFAPDGRTILTGSLDQTARLWDVKTGQELKQFSEPDGSGVSGTFSPDGQSILTGSYLAGVLHLWDVKTGGLRQTFTSPDAKEVNGVAFSPDGRQVAAALGVDRIIRLWDTASGELLHTFKGSADGVLAVAFSPDGQTLASGGYDKSARLWNITTGGEIRRFEGHTDAVESVSFSPDGRTLITASDDRTARLWDTTTGQELRRLAGHTNPVYSAVFAPDGKTIATASFDGTVKLWAGQPQVKYPPLLGVNPNSFSNGIKIASDGRSAVGAGESGLRRWDVQTGQPVRQYDYDGPLLSAAISPDGHLVLGGAGNGMLVGWDALTGEKLFALAGHQVEIPSVAISPDGRYALTAGASDGTSRLWDLTTEQVVQVFSPEAGTILDTAFSPDGRYALASGMDSLVLMWAVEGSQFVRKFELAGPIGAPSLAVSPDGDRVAIGTRVGEIALFEMDSGQQQKTFAGHTAGVRDLAFSPDGQLLLSGSVDGTARLWDLASGMEQRRYDRRPFTVHGVAFAPDSRTLLVSSSDGTARRFDVDYHDTINYLCSRLLRDLSDEERGQYGINDRPPRCPSKN